MTAEEFEQAYADRSGTTVARLRQMGRVVRPCRCGEGLCEGWQSVSHVAWLEDEVLRLELRLEAAQTACSCGSVRRLLAKEDQP